MIKKTFLYMAIAITTAISISCQEKKDEPFVQYFVQPEMELGKNNEFFINFKVKPDSVWADADHIDGLELTDELSRIKRNITESSSNDDDDNVIQAYYNFHTYAKPTRLGKINFPVLNIMVKGKQYKTPPFSINVVEKLTIGNDAVKIELSSDKAVYRLKDTVKISLYEYSKFTNSSRKHISKQASIVGKGNEIKISSEQGVNEISGIDGLEKYLEQHFEFDNFDWDPFKSRKSIETIDGVNYLKTMVFTATLLPKHKGEFKIGPSEFNYAVYKSNTDFFARLVPNNDGKYNITETGVTKLQVASKMITFKVK